MRYLLDTSVYSQPLKNAPILSVVSKWREVGDLACCVSVFCEMEIYQGLIMSGSTRLSTLYDAVLKNRIPILPFTPNEAKIYAQLQADSIRNGRTRPVIDLCIAATALSHRCILVTLNVRDFIDIPGLKIENWS